MVHIIWLIIYELILWAIKYMNSMCSVQERKLSSAANNLPGQAYEPSDQQPNPILLTAKLLLDFWNLWTFDTEKYFFKYVISKFSVVIKIRPWPVYNQLLSR